MLHKHVCTPKHICFTKHAPPRADNNGCPTEYVYNRYTTPIDRSTQHAISSSVNKIGKHKIIPDTKASMLGTRPNA